MPFRIIPLSQCFLVTTMGNKRRVEHAYTAWDCKPTGDGWQEPPGIDVNHQPMRLHWQRETDLLNADAPDTVQVTRGA